MNFNMKDQDVVPLVEHSIEMNMSYAVENKVQLVLDKKTDSAIVNTDFDRMQQVLANLISNAAKFSPENETVTVLVKIVKDRVRVEVIDNGPGISEKFRSQLFEKFAQEDGSNTRSKKGTGLGLAISRELMQRMDGEIGCDSSSDKGSTFWIELPLSE